MCFWLSAWSGISLSADHSTMEFFDYFARLQGFDPEQTPVFLRVMTFVVPLFIIIFFTCWIIVKVRKLIKTIRHVTRGIRVRENSALTPDEVRAVAVGALYAYQQGGYVDVPDLDLDKSRLDTILSEWWDITDRESAVDTADYLSEAPSQSILPLVYSGFKAQDANEGVRIITDTVNGIFEASNLPDKDKKVRANGLTVRACEYMSNLRSQLNALKADGIISSESDIMRLGVVAWDAGRLNFVARAAMQKGYLTPEECQEYIGRAYGMAKDAGFRSWRDFADSYMLGRTMWNGQSNMAGLAQDLLENPSSPWVRFPWQP